jgi:pimeloyl-ACP methyl ester carboxylesterase
MTGFPVDRLPAAVLVPGLGLGAAGWWPTVDALDARGADLGGTAVAELPGYGLRRDAGRDLAPSALAGVLVDRWLPAGERRLLLGHSASCQVVAHAAARAPDRVAGLVLVGPTTDPRAATWPRLVARWLRTAAHEQPWQVPLLVRMYHRTGAATMLRAMDAARQEGIEQAVTRSRCPVLVVRGVHDRIAPADWCRTVAAAGRGVAVTLPAGGHMVPLTHARLVAAAVAAFWELACRGDASL